MLRRVRPSSSRKNLEAEILQKEREIDAELIGPNFKLIVAPDAVNRAMSKIKCGCGIDENGGEYLCLQFCECNVSRKICSPDCGCSGRCQYNSFLHLPPTEQRECVMGKELVALQDIPFGKISFVYTGEVSTVERFEEKEKRRHGGGVRYALTASWRGREIELPGEPGNPTFVIDATSTAAGKANHSCKSNHEIYEIWHNNKIYVIGRAYRHIVKGEALTLDYQWDKPSRDDDHADICLCGEEEVCRGINAVAGSSLMQQSIEYYREEIKNLDMRNADERARIAKCKRGYSKQMGGSARQEALNILRDTKMLKAEEKKSAMYKKGLDIAIRKEKQAKLRPKSTKRSASGCCGMPESSSRKARVEQADQLNQSKVTAPGLARNPVKDKPQRKKGSLSHIMNTTPRIPNADCEREIVDNNDSEDDFPDETRRRIQIGRGARNQHRPRPQRPPGYREQLELAGRDGLPHSDSDDEMAEPAPNIHDLLAAFQKNELPAELGFQDALVGTILRNILIWHQTSGRNPPELEEVYALYRARQLPGGNLGLQDPAIGFILRDLLRWFKYSKLPERPPSCSKLHQRRDIEFTGGPRGWNNEARTNPNQADTASASAAAPSSAHWVNQKMGRMDLNNKAVDSRNRPPKPAWPQVIDKRQIGYLPTYLYHEGYVEAQSNQERAHPASWDGVKWKRPGQGNFLIHIPPARHTGAEGNPDYVGEANATYTRPGRKGKNRVRWGANTVHPSPVNLSRAGTPVRPSTAPQIPRQDPPALSDYLGGVWERFCGKTMKSAAPNLEKGGYVETSTFRLGAPGTSGYEGPQGRYVQTSTSRLGGAGTSAGRGVGGSGNKFEKDTPIIQWGDGLLQHHEILNIVLWENGSQRSRGPSGSACVSPWPGVMRWVYWLHKTFRHPTPDELQTWGKRWQGITLTTLRAAYGPGQFQNQTRPSEKDVRLLMVDVLAFPAFRRLLGNNVEDTVHGHFWPLVWKETGKLPKINMNSQEIPQRAE